MKISGRRTGSVFERYAIVSQIDAQEALEKLGGSRHSSMAKAGGKGISRRANRSIVQLGALRPSAKVSRPERLAWGKETHSNLTEL
jgi:hypothetical protein